MSEPGFKGRSQEQALMGLLQQAPVFRRLPGRYLQLLRKAARPGTLAAGEAVIPAGAQGAGLFLLIRGRWVVDDDQPGRQILEPVATAGELALLTGQPQRADVVVLEDSIVLHLSHAFLITLFARDAILQQRLCRNTIAYLSTCLQEANTAMERLGADRAAAQALLAQAQAELDDARLLQNMRR